MVPAKQNSVKHRDAISGLWRNIFTFQSIIISCIGSLILVYTALIGLVILFGSSSTHTNQLGLAFGCTALISFGLAALFWMFRSKYSTKFDNWKIGIVLTELILLTISLLAINYMNHAEASGNAGGNPISDGAGSFLHVTAGVLALSAGVALSVFIYEVIFEVVRRRQA